jgi:hypothetical protein
MSEHFDERAAFIASLPEEDPERAAALEHAKQCAPCRDALSEGERLMRLIDTSQEAREVPASSAATVVDMIEAELRRDSIRQAAWPAALVAAAFVLEVALARQLRTDPRSFGAGLTVAALAVALASLNRGKLPVVLAAIAASAVFAVTMASTSLLAPAAGLECTLLELFAAALPWVAFHRVAGPWRSRSAASAVAAAGALSGHAALHLACPVAHADAHLLVFHFGGVVLAAVVGALTVPRPKAAASPSRG